MTDLEVCRLSAEALGKGGIYDDGGAIWIHHGTTYSRHWNPLTDAEQRWACVEFLLNTSEVVLAQNGTTNPFAHAVREKAGPSIIIRCPASKFPARAVAELQRRKKP
jgi:hypothetical protein